MNISQHYPVLTKELIEKLSPKKKEVYIDATFGQGGHSKAILSANSSCKIIALDWDEKTLAHYGPPLEEAFPERIKLRWANFSNLYKILKKENIEKVDGIIADFGTSRTQLKEGEGFSFAASTYLDMRMSAAHTPTTAAQLLANVSEEELREILWRYGEEPHAKAIAHAIIENRILKPITTTEMLAEIVEKAITRSNQGNKKRHNSSGHHLATRTFQALRIVINKELENIETLLTYAPKILKPGGKFCCITFHSLEDRLVKQSFKDLYQMNVYSDILTRPITPSDAELEENPPSRTAKLRIATKQ